MLAGSRQTGSSRMLMGEKTQSFGSGRFRTLSVVCSVAEIHRHFHLLALGSYGFGMAVGVARVEVVDA